MRYSMMARAPTSVPGGVLSNSFLHYFGRFIRGVFGGFACNGDIDRAAREREWRARRGGSRVMSAWAALGGFFFPPLASARRRLCRLGVGDHRHERVAVQAMPGSAFEVVEAQFFF